MWDYLVGHVGIKVGMPDKNVDERTYFLKCLYTRPFSFFMHLDLGHDRYEDDDSARTGEQKKK